VATNPGEYVDSTEHGPRGKLKRKLPENQRFLGSDRPATNENRPRKNRGLNGEEMQRIETDPP